MSRICIQNWRENFTLGILINTRGFVALIALNLVLDSKILTQKQFAIFVVMTLSITFCTSPLLHYVFHKPMEAKKLRKETEEKKRVEYY